MVLRYCEDKKQEVNVITVFNEEIIINKAILLKFYLLPPHRKERIIHHLWILLTTIIFKCIFRFNFQSGVDPHLSVGKEEVFTLLVYFAPETRLGNGQRVKGQGLVMVIWVQFGLARKLWKLHRRTLSGYDAVGEDQRAFRILFHVAESFRGSLWFSTGNHSSTLGLIDHYAG